MKIACPRCGTTDIKDAHPNSNKTLYCNNGGHAFDFEEALIRFSDAVKVGKAIGSPTRLRILLEYAHRGEMSPTEVAKRIGKTTATARYHILKLLSHSPPLLVKGRTIPKNGSIEQKFEPSGGLFAGS
jgi:DNA-binding transcriptional ArsR family regulator